LCNLPSKVQDNLRILAARKQYNDRVVYVVNVMEALLGG
jgi:hypothetical protein